MIRTRVDSLLETKRKNMQDIRYKKSRREFLSTSAKSIVLASIALQGGFVFAKESNKSISSIQHKPMPKRILGSGKAAMQVSALAFGCMGLNYHRSKKLSKKEAQNILAQALDYGITLFGTTDSKHLRENIGALDVSFSASEWQSLEAKLDKIEIVGDRYPKEQAQRVGR